MKPIYLDYAATTPIAPQVVKTMQDCLESIDFQGNPASKHIYGQIAKEAIDHARTQIANCIHAEPSEIILTSGATESINLSLKGVSGIYQRKGKHIITMKTEHKATLDACQHLEKAGFLVTYLAPETNGLLNLDALKQALRDDTILVSIMHVNNETGIIQDIDSIAQLTRARGILCHIDAAQSIGKLEIDVNKTPVDLVSFSAHKVYGPKGIGALYLRKKPRVRVEPLIHGGGHEQGMRSGTLATHQIIGMGEAFALAKKMQADDASRIKTLRDQFLSGIKAIKNLVVNTDLNLCVPHILNLRFDGMLADAILDQLPMIAASTASACQAKSTEGSYVLRALGLNNEAIKSSMRFSFGRFTTQGDITLAVKLIIGSNCLEK